MTIKTKNVILLKMNERIVQLTRRASEITSKIWRGLASFVEDELGTMYKVEAHVASFGEFIVRKSSEALPVIKKKLGETAKALEVMDHETADKTRRYSLLGALALDAYPLNPNAAQTVFMAMGLLGLNTAVEGYRTIKDRNKKHDECMTFNPITFSFKDFRESFTAQKNRKKEFGFNDSEEADRKRWVSRRVFGWPMVHIGVSNILLNGGARLKGLEAYWNDYAIETSVLGAIALALFTWGAIKSNGSGVKKSSG